MPSRRLLAVVVAAGCAVATLALPTAPTQAASETLQETGKVTYIFDGDTIDVDVAGDGTSTSKHVRLLGVQAMESYHPSTPGTFDQCHARAAADELARLTPIGATVQLRSIYSSSTSYGRLLRSVWVQQGGVWVDVQRILINDSMGIPIPSTRENTHNAEYMTLAQRAAKGGANKEIWNPTTCGSGPDQDIPLKVIVNWDGTGDENVDLNGEWVSIQNLDPTRTISMKGWWLRDSSLTNYYFTSGTTIPPGERVTVKVGKGTDTLISKYWGQTSAVFDNGGDGAYLFDPDGDLRAWMMYPCKVSCTDPEMGNLHISRVSYDPTGNDADHVNSEWVMIHNYSTHRINMRPYLVKSAPYVYNFSPTAWIEPLSTIVIRVGAGTGDASNKYWGNGGPIFNNGGDSVSLRTYDDIVISCKAWGSVSC